MHYNYVSMLKLNRQNDWLLVFAFGIVGEALSSAPGSGRSFIKRRDVSFLLRAKIHCCFGTQ